MSDTAPSRAAMDPAVSPDAYRQTMRHWPSGVTVITIPTDDGPHGMTASAFTSVSVSPAFILIVVDKRWRSHGMIAEAGCFCVNILADSQVGRSDRFAGRHGDVDRFEAVPTTTEVTGAPVMTDSVAFLDCRVHATFEAGDHSIYLGRVVACGTPTPDAKPLAYYDQDYAGLRRLSDAGD